MDETNLKNSNLKSMNNFNLQNINLDVSLQNFKQNLDRRDVEYPHEQDFFSGLKRIIIIHLIIFVKNDLLLFQRPCGTWSYLSGQIEVFETAILAASRETKEEIGLIIDTRNIFGSDYIFSGTSPKGKLIQGQSLWTRFDDTQLRQMKFKADEIIDWQLATIDKAFGLLSKGFKESVLELIHYIECGIIPL